MRPHVTFQVEVTIPPEFEAEVVRDLERRGCTVARTDTVRVIRGSIPIEGLDDYASELRSLTAGRGTFRSYAPELIR
jgi:translation elongation factor EF-G